MAVKNRKRNVTNDPVLISKREKSAKRFVKHVMEDYAQVDGMEMILISVEEGTYRFMNPSTGKKSETFRANNKYLTKKNMVQVFADLGYDYKDIEDVHI